MQKAKASGCEGAAEAKIPAQTSALSRESRPVIDDLTMPHMIVVLSSLVLSDSKRRQGQAPCAFLLLAVRFRSSQYPKAFGTRKVSSRIGGLCQSASDGQSPTERAEESTLLSLPELSALRIRRSLTPVAIRDPGAKALCRSAKAS